MVYDVHVNIITAKQHGGEVFDSFYHQVEADSYAQAERQAIEAFPDALILSIALEGQ